VKLYLGLSDLQMGLIQGLAVAIFYSVLALPIARLAEHVSWRAAFIAVGAPGVLVAILTLLTLREPPRGMSDPTGASKPDAGTAPKPRVCATL
jgi:predicted MFS family arabinose efflux permease